MGGRGHSQPPLTVTVSVTGGQPRGGGGLKHLLDKNMEKCYGKHQKTGVFRRKPLCDVSVLIRSRKQHGQLKQCFPIVVKAKCCCDGSWGGFTSLCYKPDCSDNIRIYLDVIRLGLALCSQKAILSCLFFSCNRRSGANNNTLHYIHGCVQITCTAMKDL